MSTVTSRPAAFVSLIHGARRLNRRLPNRAWMEQLRGHLLRCGIPHVSTFAWSGGLLRGFRGLDADSYAAALLREYELARGAGAWISIVAKSAGALIAERAMLRLKKQIHVDLFLRIGVPDRRTELALPAVSRVVNVISSDDRLYRVGKWVTPFFLPRGANYEVLRAEEIRFRHLTHFQLTECTALNGEAGYTGTTHDLYGRLLTTDMAESQHVHEHLEAEPA